MDILKPDFYFFMAADEENRPCGKFYCQGQELGNFYSKQGAWLACEIALKIFKEVSEEERVLAINEIERSNLSYAFSLLDKEYIDRECEKITLSIEEIKRKMNIIKPKEQSGRTLH